MREWMMRLIGSADELERRRLHAVGLLERGEPRHLVARILGVSPGTLSRWKRMAESGDLKAKPQAGPSNRLTDDDCRELETLLSKGAVAHGWLNELWTAARVGQVIEKRFGIKYHPSHVSKILRGRLNWTCQKPEQHYRGRD